MTDLLFDEPAENIDIAYNKGHYFGNKKITNNRNVKYGNVNSLNLSYRGKPNIKQVSHNKTYGLSSSLGIQYGTNSLTKVNKHKQLNVKYYGKAIKPEPLYNNKATVVSDYKPNKNKFKSGSTKITEETTIVSNNDEGETESNDEYEASTNVPSSVSSPIPVIKGMAYEQKFKEITKEHNGNLQDFLQLSKDEQEEINERLAAIGRLEKLKLNHANDAHIISEINKDIRSQERKIREAYYKFTKKKVNDNDDDDDDSTTSDDLQRKATSDVLNMTPVKQYIKTSVETLKKQKEKQKERQRESDAFMKQQQKEADVINKLIETGKMEVSEMSISQLQHFIETTNDEIFKQRANIKGSKDEAKIREADEFIKKLEKLNKKYEKELKKKKGALVVGKPEEEPPNYQEFAKEIKSKPKDFHPPGYTHETALNGYRQLQYVKKYLLPKIQVKDLKELVNNQSKQKQLNGQIKRHIASNLTWKNIKTLAGINNNTTTTV